MVHGVVSGWASLFSQNKTQATHVLSYTLLNVRRRTHNESVRWFHITNKWQERMPKMNDIEQRK